MDASCDVCLSSVFVGNDTALPLTVAMAGDSEWSTHGLGIGLLWYLRRILLHRIISQVLTKSNRLWALALYAVTVKY